MISRRHRLSRKRRAIHFICSASATLCHFLVGHLEHLERDFDVTASANVPYEWIAPDLPKGVRFRRNGIVRKVSLRRDAVELLSLARNMRKERPWAVHTVTPKAGLLGMLAARATGVPVRVHWFTGQVWATRQGFARRSLRALDTVTARCATVRLVDSRSQLEFLLSEGVLSAARPGMVLGEGSISGVDVTRFRPDAERRRSVRSELGLEDDAIVCVFVGRLNRDKGVPELVEAFREARERCADLALVLVGPDEENLAARIPEWAGQAADAVQLIGLTDKPEAYLAAGDIYCMPSHREGFGLSVIEAAACGLPAVASRIYGLTDAVVEGVTGLLHEPGDAAAITELLCLLAESPQLRRNLGEAAQSRVTESFRSDILADHLVALYRTLDAAAGGDARKLALPA
jgi:glycosyltransferase involved in cell wall biosynthesis